MVRLDSLKQGEHFSWGDARVGKVIRVGMCSVVVDVGSRPIVMNGKTLGFSRITTTFAPSTMVTQVTGVVEAPQRKRGRPRKVVPDAVLEGVE